MLFKNRLKLYYLPKDDLVSLNIRVAPEYVLTFYIERPIFERLIGAPDPGEFGVKAKYYFLMRKKEYVRLSVESHEVTHNLRIELDAWDRLIRQYREGMSQASDKVLTCIVE